MKKHIPYKAQLDQLGDQIDQIIVDLEVFLDSREHSGAPGATLEAEEGWADGVVDAQLDQIINELTSLLTSDNTPEPDER